MNYNFNELIDVVKEKKSNLKITNKELSELSGVPYGTVNKILSGGTKSVKAETLSKLLKALGVSDNKSESEDNFGFVKVAAYTPEIKLGDAGYNAKLMISAIDKAVLDGVELLVFPELSLTGSTLGDLFMQDTLLSSSKKALLEIIKHLAGKPIVAVVGLPLKVGGMLVNSAAVISGDGLLGFSVAESDNGLFKGVKSGRKYV
jgi:transcriptional regulator with XRE-family HTH domain